FRAAEITTTAGERLGIKASKNELMKLFDKRRPQIVGVWFPQQSGAGFEQVEQRTLKFDIRRTKVCGANVASWRWRKLTGSCLMNRSCLGLGIGVSSTVNSISSYFLICLNALKIEKRFKSSCPGRSVARPRVRSLDGLSLEFSLRTCE